METRRRIELLRVDTTEILDSFDKGNIELTIQNIDILIGELNAIKEQMKGE